MNKTENKTRRGGSRPGSGRPAEDLHPTSFRLPSDVLGKIASVADEHRTSRAKALSMMVRAFTQDRLP